MGQLLDTLRNYANNRRSQQNIVARSQKNHPETVDPNQLSTLHGTISVSDSSLASALTKDGESVVEIPTSSLTNMILTRPGVTRITISPPAGAGGNQCSELYLACRNNDIDKVRELLLIMTLEDIDRLEPNGSTALHSACYHGHEQITALLLQAGADRSILNCFQCLPYDEAHNDRIRRLFLRIPNTNRFASDTGEIEWESIDYDAVENAALERQIIQSIYQNSTTTTPVDKMFEKVFKNYIENRLNHIEGIENVRRFFRKAIEEQNPIWIIKAYTAETDFYKVLNKEIAGGAALNQNERRYILALLCHHPQLDRFAFIGRCFRVVQINQNYLQKYQCDCFLMTKSFLSSSIDRKLAELFVCQKESTQPQIRMNRDGSRIKIWLMCIYNIKHHRTALNIENISQYTHEGEILIMPYSVFKIKRIENITFKFELVSRQMVEIVLDECDQYLNSSSLLSASSSIITQRL